MASWVDALKNGGLRGPADKICVIVLCVHFDSIMLTPFDLENEK